jgi:hypothetical protein
MSHVNDTNDTSRVDDAARAIQKSLRLLVIATVVLSLALAGVAAWTWSTSHANQKALCTLRSDLEARVEVSKTFLREHPEGVAGIPAQTIRDGIVNQERTILALGGLSC